MIISATLDYDRGAQVGVGQGRNSEVYMINEPQLGGVMVVKEVDKARFRNATEYFNEASKMFATTHENVVSVQYACQTSTHVCMVMPYYRKGSLATRIMSGPISVGETIRVGIGVVNGLVKIHATDLIHFDLKPSNVLFSDTDVPMVADFGQSAIMAAGLAEIPPVYFHAVAPEWFGSIYATIHWDIYQLGLLLYRAVNGDPHYQAQLPNCDEPSICNGRFPTRHGSGFLPHVPRFMRTIIRRCLQIDPADRYQSAAEVGRDMGRVSVGHDWWVTLGLDGAMTWVAKRPGQPDLVVELTREAHGLWSVNALTDGANGRRARDPANNRLSGATLSAAHRHLEDVFRRMG